MINQKATLFRALSGALLLFVLNTQAQSLKVGSARIDYIVSQTPAAKEVTNQLNIQQTQAENELKRMQKEFQDKYALYQQNGAQMTDVIRKDKETELQSLQTRLQEFTRSAEESLQTKYGQLMKPILTKIQQAIDTVALQNGYHYILNVTTSAASPVLYATEEHDITNLVLKKMGITPVQTPSTPSQTPSTTPPATGTAPKKQ